MNTVLICGSRNVIPAMLDKVEQSITWAANNGYKVICGDARGIDSAAMVLACKAGILQAVYGIGNAPRNICCAKHNSVYVCVLGDYLARDRRMVEDCDRVIGICLNKSSGTMYTCVYAGEIGKPVGIIHYKRGH